MNLERFKAIEVSYSCSPRHKRKIVHMGQWKTTLQSKADFKCRHFPIIKIFKAFIKTIVLPEANAKIINSSVKHGKNIQASGKSVTVLGYRG